MLKNKVLVVDDDKNICELLRLYIEKEGYEVEIANNGKEAIDVFHNSSFDIVLLDIMLPYIDGWEVCREIRKTSFIPIIMLTAKDEVFDKVLGLELGADDYVIKPFDVKEVIARIKAILRRTNNLQLQNNQTIEFENILINLKKYELKIKGEIIPIPPKEMELLYYLMSNPNVVFKRNQLLDKVWGFEYYGDSRTVDVHIKRIRNKLDGVSDKWELTTIWGVGYKFETK